MSKIEKIPKYVITPTGIFDNTTFAFFNLEKLYQVLKSDYNKMMYHIFHTSFGKKILFVSKQFFNFSDFETYTSPLFQKGITVEGFLYDLDTQKFLFPSINNHDFKGLWLKFFIYNDMIPHIIESSNKSGATTFAIIFWDEKSNRFSQIAIDDRPTIVSYVFNNFEDSSIIRKQILFAHASNKRHCESCKNKEFGYEEINASNLMILLNENLGIINIDNGIRFEAPCYYSTPNESAIKSFQTLYNEVLPDIPPSNIQQSENNTGIYHLYGNDAIILKSYKGDFGEFVLMFLASSNKIDYSISFFSYSQVEVSTNPYGEDEQCIKVASRKNDFENELFLISLKNKKVVALKDN